MKVHRYILENGDCFGFRVDNTHLSRFGLYLTIRKITGAKIIKRPKLFLSWFRESLFCEWTINQENFFVEEPWGDSSDFDLFCENPNTKEMEIVIEAIEKKRFDVFSLLFWFFLVGLVLSPFAGGIYNSC